MEEIEREFMKTDTIIPLVKIVSVFIKEELRLKISKPYEKFLLPVVRNERIDLSIVQRRRCQMFVITTVLINEPR